MGKPILYCGDCGRSLREEDFERGKAGYAGHAPFCLNCRPDAAPPAPEPKAPSRARIPPSSTPSRSIAPPRPPRKPPAALFAAIAGALVLLALAGALASSPKPPPRAANATPPAPEPPTPPKPEPPAPPAPAPAVVLERYLADIRAIRDNDPDFKRSEEVRSMLRRAGELAGGRKGEVDALLASYEKELGGRAEPAPLPGKKIVGFTLIDADTDKPVPGFDPLPPDSVLDLGKLGLKKIDVRINTSPGNVGPIETVIDSAKPRAEQAAPYSFTNNGVATGYAGWTPSVGRHTLKCRLAGGPWVTLHFTVVDPR